MRPRAPRNSRTRIGNFKFNEVDHCAYTYSYTYTDTYT